MPAALDGTRIVFAHEFRKQVGGKGFLIVTLTIPVLLVLAWIAIPVIRGLVANDVAAETVVTATEDGVEVTTEDAKDAVLPIGVVMQAADLVVDFTQFPEFRVYAETAVGLDDLKSGKSTNFSLSCRTT